MIPTGREKNQWRIVHKVTAEGPGHQPGVVSPVGDVTSYHVVCMATKSTSQRDESTEACRFSYSRDIDYSQKCTRKPEARYTPQFKI